MTSLADSDSVYSSVESPAGLLTLNGVFEPGSDMWLEQTTGLRNLCTVVCILYIYVCS